MEYVKSLIQSTDRLRFNLKNKNWLKQPDYVMISIIETDIETLKIKIEETEKIIQMLDIDYIAAENKPTKEF